MGDETIEIKGTEYRKGEPVIIRHHLLTVKEDKLASMGEYDSIGYLRRTKINDRQMKFIYLAKHNPKDTAQFRWSDWTYDDSEIREMDIVSIARLLTEKK